MCSITKQNAIQSLIGIFLPPQPECQPPCSIVHPQVTIQNLIGSGMDPKTENNPYLGFVYTSFQVR